MGRDWSGKQRRLWLLGFIVAACGIWAVPAQAVLTTLPNGTQVSCHLWAIIAPLIAAVLIAIVTAGAPVGSANPTPPGTSTTTRSSTSTTGTIPVHRHEKHHKKHHKPKPHKRKHHKPKHHGRHH